MENTIKTDWINDSWKKILGNSIFENNKQFINLDNGYMTTGHSLTKDDIDVLNGLAHITFFGEQFRPENVDAVLISKEDHDYSILDDAIKLKREDILTYREALMARDQGYPQDFYIVPDGTLLMFKDYGSMLQVWRNKLYSMQPNEVICPSYAQFELFMTKKKLMAENPYKPSKEVNHFESGSGILGTDNHNTVHEAFLQQLRDIGFTRFANMAEIKIIAGERTDDVVYYLYYNNQVQVILMDTRNDFNNSRFDLIDLGRSTADYGEF